MQESPMRAEFGRVMQARRAAKARGHNLTLFRRQLSGALAARCRICERVARLTEAGIAGEVLTMDCQPITRAEARICAEMTGETETYDAIETPSRGSAIDCTNAPRATDEDARDREYFAEQARERAAAHGIEAEREPAAAQAIEARLRSLSTDMPADQISTYVPAPKPGMTGAPEETINERFPSPRVTTPHAPIPVAVADRELTPRRLRAAAQRVVDGFEVVGSINDRGRWYRALLLPKGYFSAGSVYVRRIADREKSHEAIPLDRIRLDAETAALLDSIADEQEAAYLAQRRVRFGHP